MLLGGFSRRRRRFRRFFSVAMSGSEASSPDYEQDWDALEQRSLEALERSVDPASSGFDHMRPGFCEDSHVLLDYM